MKTRLLGRFRSVWGLVVPLLAAGGGVGLAQEMPGPGPEHEALKRHEGEWIATVKSPEGDSKGTMTLKMECGGLWLASDFRAEFGGMKFHGRGFDGYDPMKKKYVSVWVDSMSPRPLLLEGTMDAEKKTLTMYGEGPGPDGKPVKYKNVTRFPDADHQTFTMHVVDADGQATPMLTIEYVRKK
ncbi:MAG: DUF1579 domain-containing protein [Verrucomicrobia bacterium]|nr:DUF1579 domain-containing protein [Verrucomicrobiota bacterium]